MRPVHFARAPEIALLTFSTLLVLALSEAAFRVALTVRYHVWVSRQTSDFYEFHPHEPIVYTLKPRARGSVPYPGQQGKTWSYQLNGLGLRGPEPKVTKDRHQRVLILGDSYTFGWGLDSEAEAFPRQVEQLLLSRCPDRSVEVINAGIYGYNTTQEHQLLLRVGPRLEPDLVVLAYVVNDAEPQGTVKPPPRQLYRYANTWLLEATKEACNRFIFGGREVLPVRRHWPDRQFRYLLGFRQESHNWRESKAALDGIAGYCAARRIPFVVFVLPDLFRPLDERYPWQAIHDTVLAWCRDGAIDAVDLLPAFRGRDHLQLIVDPAHYPKGENHPNASAHRDFAEAMAESLTDLGLVCRNAAK